MAQGRHSNGFFLFVLLFLLSVTTFVSDSLPFLSAILLLVVLITRAEIWF